MYRDQRYENVRFAEHLEQKRYAYVTLATNNLYAIGALVLAHSLRRANAKRWLVVMVTSDVSSDIRRAMKKVFDLVKDVDPVHGRYNVYFFRIEPMTQCS